MSAITVPTRVKPLALGLFLGTTSFATEFAKAKIEATDTKPATFGELMAGKGARRKFTGTVQLSTDANSFHTFQTANVGKEFPLIFAPHGNKTATTNQPHFKCTVRITTPPPISQDISEEDGQFYDFEFEVTSDDVERATSGSLPG